MLLCAFEKFAFTNAAEISFIENASRFFQVNQFFLKVKYTDFLIFCESFQFLFNNFF